MVNPIITDTPSDFSVETGYTGQSLSWTAIDANPDTYTIEMQGTGIVTGPTAWTSGIAIMYPIPTGLSVGEYIYTVNFSDDYGNFVTDTITLTVKEATTDGGAGAIPFELIILISVLGSIILAVIIFIFIRRKRRKIIAPKRFTVKSKRE